MKVIYDSSETGIPSDITPHGFWVNRESGLPIDKVSAETKNKQRVGNPLPAPFVRFLRHSEVVFYGVFQVGNLLVCVVSTDTSTVFVYLSTKTFLRRVTIPGPVKNLNDGLLKMVNNKASRNFFVVEYSNSRGQ